VPLFTLDSFRSVFLARKKATGDVYAIKLLKKSEMKSKNQLEHVRNERNVLAMADNPFVVKMYYSFQSDVSQSRNFADRPVRLTISI
jgi:serine/threonine protein kinase